MESRLTFRETQTVEAWQHKIRVERERVWLESGRPRFWENVDLSLKHAVVRPIERTTAEKVILEYEWLGDMAVTNRYYGVFFGDYCGGVICINQYGHAPAGEKQFGLRKGEVSYFARGACAFWSPSGSASKLLSFALKFEKKRGAKLAIAFADTDAGEYGTVYQATNWYCIGKTPDFPQFAKGNRILDFRSFCAMARRSKMTTTAYAKYLLRNGWEKQPTNCKYKYCFVLADEPDRTLIFDRIKNKIIPYPKRDYAAET